jgi:hypothetical protein
MPLLWAHAEYVKLLRSAADGQVFDRTSAVAECYGRPRRAGCVLEIGSFNRQPSRATKGATLRVQATAPFRLHWTGDEWQTVHDNSSSLRAPWWPTIRNALSIRSSKATLSRPSPIHCAVHVPRAPRHQTSRVMHLRTAVRVLPRFRVVSAEQGANRRLHFLLEDLIVCRHPTAAPDSPAPSPCNASSSAARWLEETVAGRSTGSWSL